MNGSISYSVQAGLCVCLLLYAYALFISSKSQSSVRRRRRARPFGGLGCLSHNELIGSAPVYHTGNEECQDLVQGGEDPPTSNHSPQGGYNIDWSWDGPEIGVHHDVKAVCGVGETKPK